MMKFRNIFETSPEWTVENATCQLTFSLNPINIEYMPKKLFIQKMSSIHAFSHWFDWE